MNVLIGYRDDFAIEVGVEPGLVPPSSVWGHMCLWCRGVPLGRLDNTHCALYGTYHSLREVASTIDHLWADELDGLDGVAAWNLLDGLLYGYHGDVELPDERTLEECNRDWTVWGGFDFLTNWGEQFDGYKSFIMCPPGGPVRILSRRLPEEMGRRVEVSRDVFVAAVEVFSRWFEGEEQRLSGASTAEDGPDATP